MDAFPALRSVYLLKEKFRLILDKIKDRQRAARFLQAWVWEAQASGIAQWVKFTQMLHTWWEELLNSFNEGFTSGVVEGLNNAIRGTIRRAYGYHVFENFRLQIMVEHGDLPTPLPQI